MSAVKGVPYGALSAFIVFFVALLLKASPLYMNIIGSVGIGLLLGAIVAGFFDISNLMGYVILGAVGFGLLLVPADLLSAGSADGEPTSVSTLSTKEWNVYPEIVTSGVSLSGNTFNVPLIYNSTANTLSLDPVEVKFTVARADALGGDAAYMVDVILGNDLVDPDTSIGYSPFTTDALRRKVIYINETDGDALQDLDRAFTLAVGTDSNSFKVEFDMSPTGWTYPENFQGTIVTVNVAGATYLVNFQKTSEVT